MKILPCFILILIVCKNKVSSSRNVDMEECVIQRYHENGILQREEGRKIFNKDDTSIRMEDLSERQMRSLNQSVFEKVSRLSEIAFLDLSINNIEEIKKNVFLNFTNLRTLNMRMNLMRILNSTSFDGLMMLEELDLSYNTIFEISPKSFSQMVNLQTIDLSKNCIFHLPEYVFFRNVHLVNFHLTNNQISHLSHLMPTNQFILTMNLSANDFTNMSSILPYTNLVSLDISHNPLSPEEMQSVFTELRKEMNDLQSKFKSKMTLSSSAESSSYSNSDENEYKSNGNNNRNLYNSLRNHLQRGTKNSSSSQVATSKSDQNNTDNNLPLGRELSYGRENKKNRTKMSLMDGEISIKSTTMEKQPQQQQQQQQNDPTFIASTEQSISRNSINNRNGRNTRYNVEEWEQLMRLSRVNHMEYFTCRNCSLFEMTFLEQFTELTYIDISSNLISYIEPSKKTFQFLEKLILTNNRITSLNIARITQAWTKLVFLQIDANPMSCSYMSHIKNRSTNLNRNFQLEIDKKCKASSYRINL
jgi:Leucine-rich repeat (LRR) protein